MCRAFEDAGLPYPYIYAPGFPPAGGYFTEVPKGQTPQNGDVGKWQWTDAKGKVNTHVGMYNNGGIVHAPHSGTVVQTTPLNWMNKSMGQPTFYRREDPNSNNCQDGTGGEGKI
jgi:hypothetical protein